MKTFLYKAKKNLTESVQGVIAADSRQEAIDRINELQLIPVEVIEQLTAEQTKSRSFEFRFGRRIKSRDLVIFYGQFARLIKSGVPILRSLAIIYDQTGNPNMKRVLENVQKNVKDGSSLSSALSLFPKVFPPFDVAMIQTGESVGKLEEVLMKLVKYLEQRMYLQSKLSAAVAYPIFIVCMGVATVFIMITFVIPKFSIFFSELGQELPYITKLLISTSNFCQKNWLWAVAGFLISSAFFKIQMKSKSNLIKRDELLLKIPKIGSLIVMYETARLARAMELLIRSGMQVLQAVKMTVPILQNEILKQDLEACRKLLEQGGYFSAGMKQSKYFPQFIYHLVSVGEESGRLDEVFQDIAEWYEQDIAQSIQTLTNLLEPVIILLVGSALGLIIVAVLMPIFSINALS